MKQQQKTQPHTITTLQNQFFLNIYNDHFTITLLIYTNKQIYELTFYNQLITPHFLFNTDVKEVNH